MWGMKMVGYGALLVLGGAALVAVVPHIAQAPLSLRALFTAPPPKEAVVIFTGDLMFDRYVRAKMDEFGEDHVLRGVEEFLQSAHLVAGNLEGPVTSTTSVSLGSAVGDPRNMRFTFPTTTPALLARYGFHLVSLGNNHSLDFGREGAEETKHLLSTAGISFVGDPLREASDIVIKEVNGVRLAFIGYNEFFGQRVEEVTQAIQVARETFAPNAIIVMAHWGEEYLSEPPERIRIMGRAFVDAGANLVIGTHPHVVQPFEEYHGGRIYYSLGNFVFDQYWSEEVRCGQAVIARFSENGITYEEQEIGMEWDGSTVIGCEAAGDSGE